MKYASKTVVAYLGLGANIGDREASINTALVYLHSPPIISVLSHSSLYETEPVGFVDQPPFLNGAVSVQTTLSPQELLNLILDIEKKLGRVRNQRWGPRVIDIDILLYDESEVKEEGLIIPHPELLRREFALRPLAEIAKETKFPDGETVKKKWETFSNYWEQSEH